MSNGRYLVAKYVPHLQRMEPRNIGVVLWSPQGVEARFVAEKVNSHGEIDGRSAKSHVNDVNTYKQWISFWRTELKKEEISPATGGRTVNKKSEEFLNALKCSNSGNYFLADGGLMLDSIGSDELKEAVDYLFYDLVGEPNEDDESDLNIKSVCTSLIKETHVNSNPDFHHDYTVHVELDENIRTSYKFDYAVANGAPQHLYQRVHLPKYRFGSFAKNAHESAWMFEKVVGRELITADSGAAFVYVDDELLNEPEVRDPLVDLRSVIRVFNLKKESELQAVEAEFAKFASSTLNSI